MVSINDFVFQISQPTFFYSIISLTIAFLFIKLYLKINPSLSRHSRSLIWLIPLSLPVCVLLLFKPQILTTTVQTIASKVSSYEVIAVSPSTLSVTSLFCLGGAIAAITFLTLILCFGNKLAYKRFHIVLMASDEFVAIQEKVKTTAHKLALKEPKIGLVDNLTPNAFIVGHGQNTTVVFSLGLLKLLNLDEIEAVVAHELVHIKEKDYLFKNLLNTLNILSFFNPFSYIATSYAQKERELHADEQASALLDKPSLLADTLAKIESATKSPKLCLVDTLASNLFLVAHLIHRPKIFASHPQTTQRIQNINRRNSNSSKKYRRINTTLLLCVLVCSVIMVSYSSVQVQNIMYQNGNADRVKEQQYYLYSDVLGKFNPVSPTGVLFASESDALRCMAYLVSNNTYTDDMVIACNPYDGYLNYYVDARGVTCIYNAIDSQPLVVNGESIVINGQSGNSDYPFDLLYPKPVTIVNHATSNNIDIQYVDLNGYTCFLYSNGVIHVCTQDCPIKHHENSSLLSEHHPT